MWFHKLTSAQRKERKTTKAKMNDADNAMAINHPNTIKESYSATHKAYDRTNYGDLNRRG